MSGQEASPSASLRATLALESLEKQCISEYMCRADDTHAGYWTQALSKPYLLTIREAQSRFRLIKSTPLYQGCWV
jgi:hypothetical protein